MPQSPLKTACLAGVMLGVALSAQAIEFGAASPSAVLGAPLDFEVVLEGATADESLRRCVQADVAVGAVLLPAKAVSVGLRSRDSMVWVRVRTVSAIDDPLVGVVVSVGCPARLTRRFIVLADPATGHQPPPSPRLQSTEDDAATARAAPSSRLQGLPSRADSPGLGGPAASRGREAPAEARVEGAASRLAPTTLAGPPSRLEMLAPSVVNGRAQLERVESPRPAAVPVPFTSGASAAALAAASHASAAASEPQADPGSTALARVQSLEDALVALRLESRQQRDALSRLEGALAQAEFQSRLAWGAAALSALAFSLVAAWALRRLRQPSRAPPRWARESAAPAQPAPTEVDRGSMDRSLQGFSAGAGVSDLPSDGPVGSGADTDGARASPPGLLPAAAAGEGRAGSRLANDLHEGAPERTRLVASSAASMSAPLQAVPVEESLDLEQQVEFLTVLGQEDSAVEFLSEHLRKTGGTHPTPFLKLMELHRRRGEREGYERVRSLFNQRFNAVAAAFGAPVVPQPGLQAHAELMRSIERVWPQPLDAVTLLENLMFRNAAREPLDVSALEEIVFLHALARDLEQQVARRSSTVDVLLPLGDADVTRSAVDRRPGDPVAPAVQTGTGTPRRETDPWPSIVETEFDIGSIEMEPMSPPPGTAGVPVRRR